MSGAHSETFGIVHIFVDLVCCWFMTFIRTTHVKRVSERVLRKAMHIIRSETLGRLLASAKSLAKSLAESLTETFFGTLGETFRARQASPQSLGSDYMHGSPQDSLRDSFFLRGKQLMYILSFQNSCRLAGKVVSGRNYSCGSRRQRRK